MRNPFSRISLLGKILLATSAAFTVIFALTGWIAVNSAVRSTSDSVGHEVHVSFQAYQSLWKARADRLSSISSVLSAMSDVRAAFGTGDAATIRDTAGELWSRVSDEDAIFLVATPRGHVIASLGGVSKSLLPDDLQLVSEASPRFPAQVSGFLARGDRLYHLTITPVYVQTTGGTALLDVLVAGYDISHAVAARLKAATGGSEFIFVAGGRVIASTLPPTSAAEVADQLPSSKTAIHAGGTRYAPLITPLLDTNGAPVGQLAILRSFEAVDEQIATLRRNLTILWLVSMALGLTLTYLLARRIIEPVKALDRAAAEVARQNYDCAVTVTSEDELGRLAATFNAMCESIRHAREDLIHNERIATIGRLTTSIVHDLRNPLAAIYGGAEMLMDSQLSAPQAERLARNMYRASRNIQDLLQDLLNVTLGKAGRLERCNLRGVVSGAAHSLAAIADAQRVTVTLDIPDDLELAMDGRRIERVFMNLMGNALEVMPDGGTLSVSAVAQAESVLIEVQDSGPGIAPEIRNRIFQPFVTARKANGLGLGLLLARQAVVDHGGDMWLKPTSGHGACFCFRLPIAAGATGGSSALSAAASQNIY